MSIATDPGTRTAEQTDSEILSASDEPWVVIVWNDPINLMSYVSYVFQSYFGYPAAKAHKLMLEVHEQGRSVVASGTREEAERHTQALHTYGLWATFRRADEN